MSKIVPIISSLILLCACQSSFKSGRSKADSNDKNTGDVGNTAGDVSDQLILKASSNITDGTLTFDLDRSPNIEWDAVDGAVSYELAIGGTAGGIEVLNWTNVGNVSVYQVTGLSLSAPANYYASVRAVGPEDEKGLVASGDGWEVTSCPAGYIPVPGNVTAGLGGAVYTQGTLSNYNWTTSTETIRSTADFCVMKYEAKNGGDHTATSIPEGTPWVLLSRELPGENNDAQEACANNGDSFQLIGNQHWQAIARNIESVSSNFDTSGPVADHSFNHGHADNEPPNALAADSSDVNACFGITSNGDPDDDCGGGWHINKRTFSLSNGTEIWDFSGNVYEWVRDDSTTPQGTNGSIQAVPYTDSLKWGPANVYPLQTGNQKAGLGYGALVYKSGAVLRGGYWLDGAYAGLFYAYLPNPPGAAGTSIGFRCVFAP